MGFMATTVVGTRRREGGRPITACDQCRRTVFMDETRRRWDGLTVCVANSGGLSTPGCYERKHPFLDFQVKPDESLSLPNPRDPPDDFVNPPGPTQLIKEQLRVAQQNNKTPFGGGTGSF